MTRKDRTPISTTTTLTSVKQGAGSIHGSGVFTLNKVSGSAILVNLTVGSKFAYRSLYRATSLAIRAGGVLEVCNEDMAIFAFPNGGLTAFVEEICWYMPVIRTVASPKEWGISKVNLRFLDGN